MIRRPPSSPLFPSTPLSHLAGLVCRFRRGALSKVHRRDVAVGLGLQCEPRGLGIRVGLAGGNGGLGQTASLGAGTDQVAGSGLAFQSLYFLGALLFLLTLALNVISDAIVRRFREVY